MMPFEPEPDPRPSRYVVRRDALTIAASAVAGSRVADSVGASTVTAARPRAFVFGARGPATDGEWRWFPGIRWFAPDGRCVRTLVLGGYGATWDAAAWRAANAAASAARAAP